MVNRAPANAHIRAAVILIVFALALISHRFVALIPGYAETVREWPDWARLLMQPARWLVLLFLGCALLRIHLLRIPEALGVSVHPARIACAIGFALLCSTPMLVLGALSGIDSERVNIRLVHGAAVAPFIEELLFRGFAFGLLVQRAQWKVWPAAVITAVVFGGAHLFNEEVQVHELPGQLLSLSLIAAGGVFYAWLFYRWGFNLWIAIGLHGFMNLWYALFDVSDTPIGSTWLIAARISVVAIAVTATEVYLGVRRHNEKA